jgi:hypothetical protein
MKTIDPIRLLIEKASQGNAHPHKNLASQIVADLQYELPMTPAAGTQVKRLTIGSTYRTPIPVLHDISNRTTYPLSNDK